VTSVLDYLQAPLSVIVGFALEEVAHVGMFNGTSGTASLNNFGLALGYPFLAINSGSFS